LYLVSKLLICVVALEHFFIAWVEMFAWTRKGPKMFPQLETDFIQKTEGMAANQGLYNVFLAVGLVWSLFIKDARWSVYIAAFFLGCVIFAGTFGAITSSKSIFFKQALPAIIAMLVLLILR